MDACKAQGVETPTWCSDGGFVTITFKRPDFTSGTIQTDKEDKQTTKEDKYPLSTPQVPPKYPTSGITHSENERFLYDHERYGRCM